MATLVNRNLLDYTTGTISGTSGTAVVTGVGTAWTSTDANGNTVANVYPNDRLVVGTQEIPIKSVDSATQVTLHYNLASTVTAGTSYRILRYTPAPTGTVLAAIQQLQLTYTDATPGASIAVDNGSARVKLRISGAGHPQLAVGAAGAADGALLTALDVDPATGNVLFPANIDLTEAESTIASASTTDLGAANTMKVAVSGTTTITSFGTRAHAVRLIRFSGVLTLTHNATSLILPGAANLATAANDCAIATSDSSGNWRVRQYTRAAAAGSASPAASGANTDITSLASPALAAATATTAAQGDSSTKVATTEFVGRGPTGLRDRLRNGTFDVWQRGGGAITVTTAGAYTADGWIVLPTGASVTAQQVANGRTGALTAFALKVTGAASVTGAIIKQRVESVEAAKFAGQTVTFQAQVTNNTGGSITPNLVATHANAVDNFSAVTAEAANGSAVQACANGATTQVAYTLTLGTSAVNGLEIGLDFGNNFSTTGKSVTIAEANLRATPGVATGINSAPPPPELRLIVAETLACQRYFWRWNSDGLALANLGIGSVFDAADCQAYVAYPVQQRSAPTITTTAASTFSVLIAASFATPTGLSIANSASKSGATIVFAVTGATTGQAFLVRDVAGAAHIDFSSEL